MYEKLFYAFVGYINQHLRAGELFYAFVGYINQHLRAGELVNLVRGRLIRLLTSWLRSALRMPHYALSHGGGGSVYTNCRWVRSIVCVSWPIIYSLI
jgi:hypothetical protein